VIDFSIINGMKKLKHIPMPKKASVEEKTRIFINNVTIVHGDKYDFSKFVYKNALTKGTYICPEHGERTVIPSSLLHGHGCSACSGKCPIYAKEQFYIKMKTMHPTLDFSKFVYKDAKTKRTYICPEHGPRKAPPNGLLHGHGCRACGGTCPNHAKEQFYIKMKTMHPTYDFSKFVYKGNKTKGTYICPEHGDRTATPHNLLHGAICGACSENCSIHTKEQFYIKMKTMHPTLDFSKFVYKSSSIKGTYICPEHGPKEAIPTSLLSGSGCGQCNKRFRVQQMKIFNALKKEFPYLIFDWEKRYDCMEGLEFDISFVAADGTLIAIEYDGEQHHRPVCFGGMSLQKAKLSFENIKRRDRKKNRLANKYGIKLIRIPYYEWQDSSEEVLMELFDTIEDYL